MFVRRVELTNFRNYESANLAFSRGTTAILGKNGQGKTSLAESIAYLSCLRSFRGVPNEALVRIGTDSAIIRADVVHDDGRELLIEAEINLNGRNRVLVNKQTLRRTRDLLGVLRATVFSPDDLAIVKDGPALRRDLIDDALVAIDARFDAIRTEVDRVIRQRNVLLKQAGGRLTEDVALTLDVWDEKLVAAGTVMGEERAALIARMNIEVPNAYDQLAERHSAVELRYEPDWRSRGLAHALAEARNDDIRRGVSTVGPHRDDIEISINGLTARFHASQGEQRSVVLALRLAVHRMVAESVGSVPILVLDDVLSELDPDRANALIANLPKGQVIITSASGVPEETKPDAIVRIAAGEVVES